jgi:2-amino-4-hydroxy-6-hydroxymethyldihydropteridine diphosphokinase
MLLEAMDGRTIYLEAELSRTRLVARGPRKGISMNQEEHQAVLLLGSNIQPEQNIPRAVAHLQRQVRVSQASSIWQSEAVGSSGPDFLNSALLVSTPLDAGVLKEQVLRPLEEQLGRVRTEDKSSPRAIDIDIILFDGILLDPTLWEYAYRAVPVAELLPGYQSASGEYLKDIALRLGRTTAISARKVISGFPASFVAKEVGTISAGTQSERDE